MANELRMGIVAFGFVLFLTLCVKDSIPLTRHDKHQLEEFIHNVMQCRNIPGLSVAVVNKGEVVYTAGHGVRDINTREPVTDKTVFCIGSLTKGFTATILAMLMSDNKSLSWDTTIQSIMGNSFRLSDEHRSKYANIRDILAHKTGVPGYFGAIMTGFNLTTEELVWRMRHMPAKAHFHSKYMYNNYMYMLAGYLAEKLTAKTWHHLVEERIFRPLRMRWTSFIHLIKKWSNIAIPHMSFDGRLETLQWEALTMALPLDAAGAICSNAHDMTKWLLFNLKGARDHHGRVLVSKEHFRELHTPQMPTPLKTIKVLRQPQFPVSEGRFAYNLGWGSGTYRGYHTLLHGGRLSGFDSLIWLYPDQQTGIFTSVNGPMNDEAVNSLRVIHYYASDLLLSRDMWLNSTTACQFPDPWLSSYKQAKTQLRATNKGTAKTSMSVENVTRNEKAQRPFFDYVGKFGHLAFGNITVYFNDTDRLLYLQHGRYGLAALLPTSTRNKFMMKFVGMLRFISEADGWKHKIPLFFHETSSGEIQELVAFFIDTVSPQRFKRGLLWDNEKGGRDKEQGGTTYSYCEGNSGGIKLQFGISKGHHLFTFICILLICPSNLMLF